MIFQNTAYIEKGNLMDAQREHAILIIDRALKRVNTADPGAQFDNAHGDGWDALLDHRIELEAQIARHQT